MTDWSIYADLSSFPSPSLISGDTLRHDLILHNKHSKKVHILELTVGFESNLKVNSDRKFNNDKSLITSLSPAYQEVNFIKIYMSTLGVLDKSCFSLINMLKDLDSPENTSSFQNRGHYYSFYILTILPQKQRMDRSTFDGLLTFFLFVLFLFFFHIYT